MRLLHFVRNDVSSFCKLFIDPINKGRKVFTLILLIAVVSSKRDKITIDEK